MDNTVRPLRAEAPAERAAEGPLYVEIVVPVYNEEADLERSIRRLTAYLDAEFPLSAVVTIADNASTDGTLDIARRLAREIPSVRVLHLDRKGRGRALRAAWMASHARVVAYMDVDLSTDLRGLLPLVAPLISGHSDVAIGSRLAKGSAVVRGPKREVISRIYNLILKATVRTSFTDAQCGFKAVRTDVAHQLVPMIRDEAWFFDTELLVLAERNGLRIHEVPVDWVDDPDSRVDIVRTATDDLKGVARLMGQDLRGGNIAPELSERRGLHRLDPQMLRFIGVGVASTVAHLLLFLAARGALGALWANAVALGVTTGFNLAAHRRLTFRVERHEGDQLWGLWLLALALAVSTVALLVADRIRPGLPGELVALALAGAVVSIARFVALRARLVRRHELHGDGADRTEIVLP